MVSPTPSTNELIIRLRTDATEKLKVRAAASGQDVATFVSRLVEQFAEPPTPIEELSGPIYQKFLESGMTDEELGDELERAKHEMRAERRARLSS
jgi:hypothetical protein